MARTVYIIDLMDPPLHQQSRKKKAIKSFIRKISSGENLKLKSGRTTRQDVSKQSNTVPVHRMDSAGEMSTSVVVGKPPQRLPRSSSEPGIMMSPTHQSVNTSLHPHNHHLEAIHSDSCVPGNDQRDLASQTKSEELIAHEDLTEPDQPELTGGNSKKIILTIL